MNAEAKDSLLKEALRDEIEAYHMHVYFMEKDEPNRKSALQIRSKIVQLATEKYFNVKLGQVNDGPRGPHIIGSYEIMFLKEEMSHLVSWIMQNHGPHSVLMHPLTRYELCDHTIRAMWLGQPLPLNMTALQQDLGPNSYADELLALKLLKSHSLSPNYHFNSNLVTAVDNSHIVNNINSSNCSLISTISNTNCSHINNIHLK